MPASQQKERVKKTITRHEKKKKKSEEGWHYEKHRDWQRQSF
jgi:hypothetical protein